ncbi:thiamine phosphate synthase [Enterovirga rhinocerotis]|uniref:Thiamine-phosphate pyrophosphorylase n=1 Tax=Enterovirga rhinocerotis TaxID=1339210 RepID=A0A4R7CB47_9HYPH|nr:thiamine phosphate synthase [Enterovirga rhinocerotis]TDR94645.1 thiamine-phosphate pyrophosphorylase [Enterovirga rhinocerotis]
MTSLRPSLYLLSPLIEDPSSFRAPLAEAVATGFIEAVLLRLAPREERALINAVKELAPVAQDRQVAVIVADPGDGCDLAQVVMRSGADGGHAEDPARIEALCQRLKDGRNIGAGGLKSKHDAMVAGELGVDYVLFGEPRPDGFLPPFDLIEDRAAWWAEIFQTPCVVYAPTLEALPAVARTGSEFVALGDAVWTHPDGPGAALRETESILAALPPRAGA